MLVLSKKGRIVTAKLIRDSEKAITAIVNSIGRNKSTVSRELSRNTVDGNYSAVSAQAAYEQRRKGCRPKKKLSDPLIFNTVRDKFLDHQWSPEQISERSSWKASHLA